MPPPSTPIRPARITQLTENDTPPTSPSGRSPLSARRGYTNTPVSGRKKKKEDQGDKGKGKGVRAEQGKYREVPATRVNSSIQLIGLPSPSLNPFSRRILNPFPPLARISSQDQLYDDLYRTLGAQHTGEVSDSSIQFSKASEDACEGGAGVEELDDIGDVSELLCASEEETILGHPTEETAGKESLDKLSTVTSLASTDSISFTRKDDPANFIGQDGHVPRRVKEIETQHKAGRHLPITPPAKKLRTGKNPIIPMLVESAEPIHAESPRQETIGAWEPHDQVADPTTMTLQQVTDAALISSSSSFRGASPISKASPSSGHSIAQLVDMVDSLQSRLEATTIENVNLRSENADLRARLVNSADSNTALASTIATSTLERKTMETEIAHHRMVRKNNDETILRLEEEKRRLVLERKFAEADLEELQETVLKHIVVPGSGSTGFVGIMETMIRRKRGIEEVDEEGSGDDLANRQTVEMLRQAGMFSHDHWSNTAQ